MRFLPLATGAGLLLGATLLFSLQNSSNTEDQIGTGEHAAAPIESRQSTPKNPPHDAKNPILPRSQSQGGTGTEMDIVLDDTDSPTSLTPIELQALTHRLPLVRQSALAKLETLSKRHKLTMAQREKLFPLLVESTVGYHPAMKVRALRGGSWIPAETSGSRTVDEAIQELLDSEQNEQFVEDQMD